MVVALLMIESVEMIIRQPGHPDRVVRLQEGATRLGRSEDCEIVLSDVGVSRRHARLLVARDQVQVEDLGSGNGTYYRGRRVEREVLHDGDGARAARRTIVSLLPIIASSAAYVLRRARRARR